MKLPGKIDFGVQSLGRRNVNLPGQVAAAENQARAAFTQAVSVASGEVAKIASAEGLADANLTLSERIVQDKKGAAELQAYIENTRVVNLKDDNVPDSVRKIAAKWQETNGAAADTVYMSDIAVDATEHFYEQSRDATFKALQAKDQSDKTTTAYNQVMDDVWANGAANAVRTTTIHRLADLKARAELQLNMAINALDENEAINIVLEAEQSGIMTPDVAGKHLAAIGATIDDIRIQRALFDAESQLELDNAVDMMDESRVTPEQRRKLTSLSDQRENYLYEKIGREQKVTYGTGQSLLIKGELTETWIIDQLNEQKLSGGQANTLRTALAAPAPLSSNVHVVDTIKRGIVALRWPDDTDDPASIIQRAQDIRGQLVRQYTGVGDQGRVDRSITADDLDALMKDIDDAENTALGEGGQSFKTALSMLKASSGYSDSISQMIDGPYPAGQAFSEARAALRDYMALKGQSGDPVEWAAKNSQRFTADKYTMSLGAKLSAQYPQYADMFENMSQAGGAVNDVMLLNRARVDVLNGDLPPEDYDHLRRQMQYRQFEANPTNPADEAEQQGAGLLQ